MRTRERERESDKYCDIPVAITLSQLMSNWIAGSYYFVCYIYFIFFAKRAWQKSSPGFSLDALESRVANALADSVVSPAQCSALQSPVKSSEAGRRIKQT